MCLQDIHHSSNSAYLPYDNYTEEVVHPEWWPQGYTHHISGHACYDPLKAPAQHPPSFLVLCVIPSKVVQNSRSEPLLVYKARSSHTLQFFQGEGRLSQMLHLSI